MPHTDHTPSQAAIEVRDLTKAFGDLTAVDHLNLTVQEGEIFGIVGPDGAGKTTLMRMLAGIMDPASGTANVCGLDIRTQAFAVKDHLAYMSQRFGLYPDLTVMENILFYADLYGVRKKDRKSQIEKLLGFSQMTPFTKRRAGALSGGMKQKLQLICALIHTPAVLLLDEPTNGVDPVSRRDFWRILYDIVRDGVSILVTTAYLDEAERCDRIGLMSHGQLLAAGTVPEVKAPIRGRVLTLEGGRAREISQILKADLKGASVTIFGDRVRMVCVNPTVAKEAALKLIREAGLAEPRFREAIPSLEDVFVSMMEKKDDHRQTFPDHDLFSQARSESGAEAVSVDGLTRVFGDFTAVNHISFSVPRGEIFGFLGPNGAGKSTTIRMLCGLLAPSSGQGHVAGFDISREAEKIKQHIGYMSQKFSLYEDLTVEENIRFYGGIYGLSGEKMETRKAWAIDMAGLSGLEKAQPRVLSAGWKQRLALACAILHEPPIIFLDEPTSGVDPISRRKFWDMIHAMAERGITVFVTTHYMEEAEYCDRIALIYKGNMIAMGTPMELKTRSMDEEILDLRCERPQSVLPHISKLPGLRDAALFGAGLHIVTEDAKKTEPLVREALADLGVSAFHLEKILPGMEDVFISLIEADDRKRQQVDERKIS